MPGIKGVCHYTWLLSVLLKLFIHFVWMCTYTHTHTHHGTQVGVRKQFVEVDSLHIPCGFQKSNSYCQVCQQAPLPAESRQMLRPLTETFPCTFTTKQWCPKRTGNDGHVQYLSLTVQAFNSCGDWPLEMWLLWSKIWILNCTWFLFCFVVVLRMQDETQYLFFVCLFVLCVCFFLKTGFHSIDQAGSKQIASASQVSKIHVIIAC